MAHRKAGGSSDNGRDSNSNRLGVKLFGGQFVRTGGILVRQRGSKYEAGNNVFTGKDYTLHATTDGFVKFTKKQVKVFTGKFKSKTFVNVTKEIGVKKVK